MFGVCRMTDTATLIFRRSQVYDFKRAKLCLCVRATHL